MYLWRKTAERRWLSANEEILQRHAGGKLVAVMWPNRKRLLLEVACKSRIASQRLVKEFGGHSEKFPSDWLARFVRAQQSKPLTIGKRLLIFNVEETSASRASRHKSRSHILVPAGAGFGTGEHPTTAMSLRLLEQITRGLDGGWSLVDLGTGSGILALAASCFGAKPVAAIDLDPAAISTAKANARLNKIDNVHFRVGDVRRWKPNRKIDIVTANLTSELLIEILRKLKHSRWLILSGILHSQEKEFIRTLRHNKIDIVEARRRGKWIADLGKTI